MSKQRYVLMLEFNSHAIASVINEIKQTALHIPAFWQVEEQDRQFIEKLKASGTTKNGFSVVMFSIDTTENELTARREELLNVLTKKYRNIPFNLPYGTPELPDVSQLICKNAVAGFADDVQRKICSLEMHRQAA